MSDPNFEEKVKNSFFKVKEDINSLGLKITDIKEIIKLQQEQIELLLNKIEHISQDNKNKANFSEDGSKSSIGNEGVYANMRADSYADMHIKPRVKDQNLGNLDSISSVDKTFLNLTRREFLLYLTVYQLEDDFDKVTYDDLSRHLKLTPGCIRTHISNIIKKGLPIQVSKINNKIVILSIPKEFRNLNLKTRLINLYNNQDPSQKKLI